MWYCVEFDFTFYDSSGSPSSRYLWLHEGVNSDGVGENRAYISSSSAYSCDTSNPSDLWGSSNPLRGMLLYVYSMIYTLMLIFFLLADGAHCPVIPDEAVYVIARVPELLLYAQHIFLMYTEAN